ncbi:hypothetical protein IIA15_02750, partial [candidate division TA06 bacterium]|nr:hypothetical protein [candidate division TA06 bacterium]
MAILATVIIFTGCNPVQPPIERNPNLHFLAGKPDYPDDTFFNSVWSTNGNTIYYLKDKCFYFPEIRSGDLWSIKVSGSDERMVLSGNFSSLAIAPDGSKLALVERDTTLESGIIVLVDPVSAIKETVVTTSLKVQDVEFSSDGLNLYYYAEGGISSIGIDGVGETLILDNLGNSFDPSPFDLSPDDSKIF